MSTSLENQGYFTDSSESDISIDTEIPQMSTEAYRSLRRHANLNGGLKSEAFPHQEIVLGDIRDFLRQGGKEGHIELATSTGKTYLIAKLAEAFYQGGLRTLILVPKVPIANQIAQNEEKGLRRFAKSVPPAEISKHYGGDKAGPNDRLVVSTYAALNNFAIDGRLGEFDVILGDEAHLSLGSVTKSNLKSYSPEAVKLGFTATPVYGVNKKVNEVFGRAIHSITLPEAIEMDLVSPVQCLLYSTEAEIPFIDQQSDFSQRELERLIGIKSRNEKAVEFAKSFIADGRQGIISCLPGGNLAHPRMLAKELNGQMITMKDGSKKNIRAVAVGSHDPGAQEETLKQYELGNIDVLTFVKSISEGWDSERASFLINTCPTTSMVRMKQLIGRVLRKKMGGLASIVVDFVDRSERKRQVTAAAALGDSKYEFGKIHASQKSAVDGTRSNNIAELLSSELYENISGFDGVQLSEVSILVQALTPEEIEARYYNHLLASEGVPDEPDYFGGVPQAVQKAVAHFRANPNRSDTQAHKMLARLKSQKEKGGGSFSQSDAAIYRYLTLLMSGNEVVEPYDPLTMTKAIDEANSVDSTDDYIRATQGRMIYKYIDALSDRQSTILKSRFELNGTPKRALGDLGREFGITRERVRAIESDSIKQVVYNMMVDQKPGSRLSEHDWVGRRIEYFDEKIRAAHLKAIVVAFRGNPPYRLVAAALESLGESPARDEVLVMINKYKYLKELYQKNPGFVTQAEYKLQTHEEWGVGRSIEEVIVDRLNSFDELARTHILRLMRKNLAMAQPVNTQYLQTLQTRHFYEWIDRRISDAVYEYHKTERVNNTSAATSVASYILQKANDYMENDYSYRRLYPES